MISNFLSKYPKDQLWPWSGVPMPEKSDAAKSDFAPFLLNGGSFLCLSFAEVSTA